MNATLARRILNMYGVRPARILAAQTGYRNTSFPVRLPSGHLLNLIAYKEETGIRQRIRRANSVSNFLALRGMPVRRCQGPILKMTDSNRVRYAALYDYLPGGTIPWEAYSKDHIKLLGKTMSVMHALLRGYEPSGGLALPDVIDECGTLLERMEHYFSDKDVITALRNKLGLRMDPRSLAGFELLLDACRQLPDRQALHMDFVRGNVLFSHTRDRLEGPDKWCFLDDWRSPPYISGILDFEKASYGPAVFDAARTLAFLLVDCKYKLPRKVVRYFVESGYQKRGSQRLADNQLSRLKGLMRYYLLYDFYKFLRHNPYESLPHNEHFVRTRDFLLEDGIIKRIPSAETTASALPAGR